MFFSLSQAHGGTPCNDFMMYALAHKRKATAPDTQYNPADRADAYTNTSVYPKLTEYTSVAHERHREDFDPATQPLDTDLLMRLGGGKQHGRYWMANSTVDSGSVPSLDEIRSRSTGSSIPIRPRQQSSQHMMAQL